MMKEIKVVIEYPEEREAEMLLPMAKKLGYKDGDLHEFMQTMAKRQLETWVRVLTAPPAPPAADIGFGDTLARWIRHVATPFRWLSMNCGCDKRRKWLNKMFPYKTKQK